MNVRGRAVHGAVNAAPQIRRMERRSVSGPASHCTAEIAAHVVARKGSSIDPLQRRDYVGGLFLASACCVHLSWAVSRSQVFSVTPRSRSLYFCTLPLSVVGSSRTNSRYLGIAK